VPSVFGIFVVLTVLVIAIAVLVAVKGSSRNRINRKAPVLTSQAHIVANRTAVVGGTMTPNHYFATFELPDGQRLELEVGAAAGQLVVGDQGTLYWQGNHFAGFQREILR